MTDGSRERVKGRERKKGGVEMRGKEREGGYPQSCSGLSSHTVSGRHTRCRELPCSSTTVEIWQSAGRWEMIEYRVHINYNILQWPHNGICVTVRARYRRNPPFVAEVPLSLSAYVYTL